MGTGGYFVNLRFFGHGLGGHSTTQHNINKEKSLQILADIESISILWDPSVLD